MNVFGKFHFASSIIVGNGLDNGDDCVGEPITLCGNLVGDLNRTT